MKPLQSGGQEGVMVEVGNGEMEVVRNGNTEGII